MGRAADVGICCRRIVYVPGEAYRVTYLLKGYSCEEKYNAMYEGDSGFVDVLFGVRQG